jgi:hypothetical protein
MHEQGKIEFSFYGDDQGQEVFGRGWAKINSQGLCGELFFHEGDASKFQAIKEIPMNQGVLLKQKKKSSTIDRITLFG